MDDSRAKHGQERIPAKKMREGILAPADSEFGFGEEAAIPASPASGAAFPAFERRYGKRGLTEAGPRRARRARKESRRGQP
jgi:hypothetical protein